MKGGKEFTPETLTKLIDLCNKEYIKGLSILGGEPLCDENFIGIRNVVTTFKSKEFLKDKDIWIWTGYEFEDIYNDPQKRTVLEYIDYMVCGQFIDEKKNLNLKWAGSENQRWIDVQKSLKEGKAALAGDMFG